MDELSHGETKKMPHQLQETVIVMAIDSLIEVGAGEKKNEMIKEIKNAITEEIEVQAEMTEETDVGIGTETTDRNGNQSGWMNLQIIKGKHIPKKTFRNGRIR